jgi:hypothetical protein
MSAASALAAPLPFSAAGALSGRTAHTAQRPVLREVEGEARKVALAEAPSVGVYES